MLPAFCLSTICLIGFAFQEKDVSREKLTEQGKAALRAGDHDAAIELLYRAKSKNPRYRAQKRSRSLPSEYHDFAEDKWIRQALAALATERETPADAEVRRIPIQARAPKIDGRIGRAEWSRAYRCDLGSGSTLFLQSDGKRLFIACDATRERTKKGFDQLRFYLHVGLGKWIANERIHVSRNGRVRALRETKVRPRRSSITDWNVYRHVKAATELVPHRQYEAVIDLKEASLVRGVPFNAFVEVETDPKRDARGKFKGRQQLGGLGNKRAPVWFVVGRHTARPR